MPASFATGVATNVTNPNISVIVQKLSHVIDLQENVQILDTTFTTVEGLLTDIRNQFQDQLPGPVESCLEKMDNALGKGEDLLDRAKQRKERGWFLRCCCFICNPNLPKQIRAWKAKLDDLSRELEHVFSIYTSAQPIVLAPAPQADLLLQPVPNSGYIGSGFRFVQAQLQTWLTEPHCQARLIGVYGMAGVGKTSLLKVIYNTYKEEGSGVFDAVVWSTVSQNFQIKDLQASIAEELKLNFEGTTMEARKMELCASLQNKKFLLILDDVWNPIDLINEVGVGFGDDDRSKVMISSRNKDVIRRMGSSKYSMRIPPLSAEESWDLFRRGAFANGVVESNIEESIARDIALQCEGLPLAIIAVAEAMSWKKTNDEWIRALETMRNEDPSFPTTHSTINELYQKLRLSYDDLPDHLKICFLYLAAFAKGAKVEIEFLVELWIGEGLLTPEGATYLMDIVREYIGELVSRCLVEYYNVVSHRHKSVKVHGVLRDMAIYIGRQENWLLAAGKLLQDFPSEEETRNCKRISVCANAIHDLPMDFKCSNLVSLMLSGNTSLAKVPEGFLLNLTCLKVLSLSSTSISSLPTSVGQLGQLRFLDLSFCYSLKDLPQSICNLSCLEVLDLQQCDELHSLPPGIGALKELKYLNLRVCQKLQSLPSGLGALKELKNLDLHCCISLIMNPHDISQLTSLNKLVLPLTSTCTVNAEDLTNLSNLMELQAVVKSETRLGTMGPWPEMRALSLMYDHDADTNTDGTEQDILPESLKHMKKLERLCLYDYQGLSLPNCICDFQNMKALFLTECHQLRELFVREIGSFPMLEKLGLRNLDKLESFMGPSYVWSERTMPNLEYLNISNCPFTKKLLSTMEKLPSLTQLDINGCNDLVELDLERGTFPMLRYFSVTQMNNLESIGGSLGMWNEETLPNLVQVMIRECPLLFPSGTYRRH